MAETLRAVGGERGRLEAIVERSLAAALRVVDALLAMPELPAFVDVCAALRTIRDQRLYDQPTFAAYLRERWGLRRSRGHQLMQASEVLSTMVDTGVTPPQSERVARELVPLLKDPAELAATWREVLQEHPNGDATHKDVARVRDRRKAAKSGGVVGVKGTVSSDDVLADDDREFMENTSKGVRILYDIESLADDTWGLDDEFVQRFIACHFEGTPEMTLQRKQIDGLIAFLRLVRPYGRV